MVGLEDGLGVECLSGSGAIAGAYSRAFREGFTITLVSGRTVGIGAYLARLGRRCEAAPAATEQLAGWCMLQSGSRDPSVRRLSLVLVRKSLHSGSKAAACGLIVRGPGPDSFRPAPKASITPPSHRRSPGNPIPIPRTLASTGKLAPQTILLALESSLSKIS